MSQPFAFRLAAIATRSAAAGNRPSSQKWPAEMETHIKRTLVKSAPELWELADDPVKMELWMATLTATAHPIEVEVTHREPERVLAWRTQNGGPFARIAVELEEKGFGTAVCIRATCAQAGDPEGALETVLDELSAPARRPFTNA